MNDSTWFLAILCGGCLLIGCSGDTVRDDDGGSASGGAGGSASSGGTGGESDACGQIGPPSGACSAGDECLFMDAGCTFDNYCKDGSWAFVRFCGGVSCPREGLNPGASCTEVGVECLYNEANMCVLHLQCLQGEAGQVWTDVGC